ncbi:MAG: sodium/proline symporter PutP [Actinomycetaceae bacterium]|nr:sodium/proline symporter PutP [Actinomycetaceae bacterium]
MDFELNGQAIAMIIYFVAMIIIGIYGYMRTSNLDDYMLGGRSLPPAVAALSAGAADMSGWLLMGLPGTLYLVGVVEIWIAVGLTLGAWLNWKIVAPRLRVYTAVSGNSITVPSYFSHRLKDPSNFIRVIAGIIILIFFTFYVSSGMVAGGTFFESTFGMNYHVGMVLVAGIVILYTLIGGFLAVSWTDTVQGIMMLLALVMVPIFGLYAIGGWSEMTSTLNAIDPNLLSLTGGDTSLKNFVNVLNGFVWGLGYFGMPHIIVRFMAIRTPHEATNARRIGIGWMVLSVFGAVFTALVGRVATHKGLIEDLTAGNGLQEAVFLKMGQHLFSPIIAGFMLAAILAAIMSTISSQLIVTSSALVEDVYRAFTVKDISGKEGVLLGRIAVLAVSVVAALLAWPRSDTVLGLVAFAWAGFGAAFGPIVIMSLYSRRLTWQGAVTGMVAGAVMVPVWKYLLAGYFFGLYELLPGFLINFLLAWIVSKTTYRPNEQIDSEMDEMLRRVAMSSDEFKAEEAKDPKGEMEEAIPVPETPWKQDNQT